MITDCNHAFLPRVTLYGLHEARINRMNPHSDPTRRCSGCAIKVHVSEQIRYTGLDFPLDRVHFCIESSVGHGLCFRNPFTHAFFILVGRRQAVFVASSVNEINGCQGKISGMVKGHDAHHLVIGGNQGGRPCRFGWAIRFGRVLGYPRHMRSGRFRS